MSSRRSVYSEGSDNDLFNRMQDVENLDLGAPDSPSRTRRDPRLSGSFDPATSDRVRGDDNVRSTGSRTSDLDQDSSSFYSVSDEDEYGLGDDDSESRKIKESIFSPLYIFFLIIIIIGIVINLILLSRLELIDRNGNPLTEDQKTMATINGIGFAILLTIILVGGFYMVRYHGAIKNTGLSVAVAIFITFIIIFLMGLLMGEYMDVGHLWAPIQPIIPNDEN